jgi:hypothetical protein
MTDAAPIAEPVPETGPAPEPTPPEPPPPPPEPAPPPPMRRSRQAPIVAALAIVAIVALVLASPFWAPALMPLLPWAASPSTGAPAALSTRLDQIQAAQTSLGQAVGAAAKTDAAALGALDKRVAALETKPSSTPSDLSGIQQQIAALTATAGALDSRIAALEKTVKALPAGDPTDAALALVALQIGDAVRAARPFAAEYDTFVALARSRSDLAAAAQPLAGAAKAGLASRAVLTARLRALDDKIATVAPPAPAADDWRGRIVARLRSLVTIRRVDGGGETPAQAAVGKAEQALAGGDLAGAVAALQPLTGSDAEAAKSWLQMAAARLQAEQALREIATLLAAHLGAPGAAAAPPG